MIAQLPNDELADVSFARPVFAELRYAKVFRSDGDGETQEDLGSTEVPAALPGP